MERERNNLFKFATKELSQDAFLAWSINSINYEEHYPLGRDMLKLITQKFLPELNYGYKSIEVDIKKQYRNIDILLIINKQYFIIIEDKKNTSEHDNQIERYKQNLIKALDENRKGLSKKEIEKIRDNKNKLDITTFDDKKVYTVYLKTGRLDEKDKKLKVDNIVTNYEILKVLEKYKGSINIVEEFYENLLDDVDLIEDKSDRFIGKSLKVGERFGEKYYCFNCFADQLEFKEGKRKYDKEYQYTYRGVKNIPNTNFEIWTPKTYTRDGWVNKFFKDSNEIQEYKIEKGKYIERTLAKKQKYRYVFLRKRNEFNKEYFEFVGIFYFNEEKSSNTMTIWQRYMADDVSLNAKKMEKELDKCLDTQK